MINALHLIWIIPCATTLGFLLCALLSANGRDDDRREWKDD